MLLTFIFTILSFLASVNVASLATSGDGSQANPWRGWETLTVTDATEYRFCKGWFAYSASPNWLKPGIAIVGEAGANLKHTGSGDAFVMDAGATVGGVWIQNVRVENLTIWGNVNTRHGFFLRGVRNGEFRSLSVKDVPQAGLWSEACVTNILSNFRVTYHEPTQYAGFAVTPRWGIVTAGRGADWSTTWTIINPVIEGVSEAGIWFKADSYGNTIINGTSEGNDGKGIVVDGNYNTFTNTDVEANWTAGVDFEINGSFNTFTSIFSQQLFKIHGSHNILTGGKLQNLTVTPFGSGAAYYNILQGPKVQGSFTDTGNNTIYYGVVGGNLTTKLGMVLPVSSYPTIINGILNTNAQLADFYSVFVDQSFTLANPTNAVDGQKVTWKFTTNGPTQWTIIYGNQFRGKNGIFPQMSFSPPGASWWYLTARYNAAQQTWDITDYSY
jgi:hypothetical protein